MSDEYWSRFRIEFIPDRENIGGLAAYSDMGDFMEDNLEGDPDLPFSYLDLDEEQLYMAGDENDTVVIQSLGKLSGFSGKFAGYEWGNMASNAREFGTTESVVEYLSEEGLDTNSVPQSEIEEMIGEKKEQASESRNNTFHRRRVDLDHIPDFGEDDMRFS